MANYPTQDPSFTTKNAGDIIQPSHVNGLQDEVAAIGAALRGSLAHGLTVGSTYSLNVAGGNSTLGGSLQVSGGSTLNTLSVSGGSTFAGAVTFAAAVTFSTALANNFARYSFRRRHAAAQTIADATDQGLLFDTTEWNTPTVSTGAGGSTATFLQFPSTGIWTIGTYVPWQDKTVGLRSVELRVDNTVVASQKDQAPGSGNADVRQTIQTICNVVDSTQTIRVVVHQTRGSTVDVSSGVAVWGQKLSV